MRITEYVGKEGVISSTYDYTRASRPRPADIFQWKTGEFGRIEAIVERDGAKFVHCCYSMGSAFLGIIVPELNERQMQSVTNCPEHMRGEVERRIKLHSAKVYLSISGGPFIHIPIEEFQVTYRTHPSDVWNWGDNLAGADMGVQYTLYRPLFTVDRDRPAS